MSTHHQTVPNSKNNENQMVNSLILTLCKDPFAATRVIMKQMGMVVKYVLERM
jgi:hypothetical protein